MSWHSIFITELFTLAEAYAETSERQKHMLLFTVGGTLVWNGQLVTEIKNSNTWEMEIQEENVLSDDVESQFFTMKRNSDDAAVKTEVKSENSCSKHPVMKIKCETATCSNNWSVDMKIGNEEETLVSDFGSQNEEYILPENPVTKDKKYNVDHELYNKIEIKEEPCWLETETSSVCDDVKDGDFPPVKSSRLCIKTVSGDNSDESPLSSAEVSGRNTTFCNVRDHLQCESEKNAVREMLTTEENIVMEQSGKCSDRLEMFLTPSHLKLKVLTHNNERPRQCNICAKDCSHLSLLKRHNLIQEPKKTHQCTTCDKRFTQLTTLKTHNLIHEGKKPHQCKACDKRFSDVANFKRHCLIHEGKKPHQCKTCDKRFSDLSNLKRHYLIHDGEKPYQCKTCDKSFTRSSDLKAHNFIHEGKKPHQCKICDKSFTALSHLRIHNLIHEGKKPHQCKTCEKRFTRLADLKKHNLMHEGKKPYKCETCEKRFARLSVLQAHNLIHVGNKPHQCNTCQKKFTRLSDLKTHNLIHEGKKPHYCQVCDKSFTRLASLKRHNLLYEGKKPHQ